MTGGWSRASSEGAVPVELRFIDLYMAALGALLFMAMLLAYLLPDIPPPDVSKRSVEIPYEKQPLSIATQTMPAGTAGVKYHAAIAYRGGAGIVGWELLAGQSDLPPGVVFDKRTGILAGVAGNARTARIVVRARDSIGNVADQPFEVVFHSPPVRIDQASVWAARFFLLAMLIFAWRCWAKKRNLTQLVKCLRDRHADGDTGTVFQGANGVEIHVKLPEGIESYDVLRIAERRKFHAALIAAAALAGVLVYLWLRK